MSDDVKTQPCPACGDVMQYKLHDDVLEHQGQTRTIKTLGWWCSQCGEGILMSEPLLAHEQAFREFKAEVDHVLGPKEKERNSLCR